MALNLRQNICHLEVFEIIHFKITVSDRIKRDKMFKAFLLPSDGYQDLSDREKELNDYAGDGNNKTDYTKCY